MTTMTYGTMPTREEFDEAFDRECPNGYNIVLSRSDSRAMDNYNLGDGKYTARELWFAIKQIVDSEDVDTTWADDGPMNLVSSIMETLGFEWV